MLKPADLRTLAKAAKDLGKPELTELVAQLQAVRLARHRAEMRQLLFRIQADRVARHAEIHQLIAEFQRAHAERREELDELRAKVKSRLADYAATNREGREEWHRQLVAIERANRGLEQREGRDDKAS